MTAELLCSVFLKFWSYSTTAARCKLDVQAIADHVPILLFKYVFFPKLEDMAAINKCGNPYYRIGAQGAAGRAAPISKCT